MWWPRLEGGWRVNSSIDRRSCGVHLPWPLLGQLSRRTTTCGRPSFGEGFLVAIRGTIRHEAARRSLLFDRRPQAREPAVLPRLI